jgi:HEPN domain-containing protein
MGKSFMASERLPADDPREWLNRARSNLVQASEGIHLKDVYLEDLCFQAQQAAEKAIKAVLIDAEIRFPYTHDLATLLSLVEKEGIQIPENIRRSAGLTGYAIIGRYPVISEQVTREEYEAAVNLAKDVVDWAYERIYR